MRESLKRILKNTQPFKRLFAQIDSLRLELADYKKTQFMPPGHYYSPIPSLEEVRNKEEQIFKIKSNKIPGIDLREDEQLQLFEQFISYYNDIPFRESKHENLRYFYENPSYSYSDAIFLYGMIRHAKPKRLIEVGSGYTSCVTLDTNEIHFNNSRVCQT